MERNEVFFYICVPVYKVEEYIDECIQSVLNQTYKNYKLILIDDGSPDRSGEICETYAKIDNRLIVFHQKNKGLIAARRVALKIAKNESNKETNDLKKYVIFLDSDDSLKLNALEVLQKKIIESNCDMIIYGMDRVIDKKLYSSKKSDLYVGVIENKSKLYSVVLKNSTYNPLCRKAIKLELFSNDDYSNYYKIKHAEDLLQSLELYKNVKRVLFIKEHLYNYTLNSKSITQSIKYENFEVNTIVREKVLQFIFDENIWRKEEINEYLKYCRKLLKENIFQVISFDTNMLNKKKMLEKIQNNGYYCMITNDITGVELYLRLFKSQKYNILIFLVLFRIKLKRILTRIRNIKRKKLL